MRLLGAPRHRRPERVADRRAARVTASTRSCATACRTSSRALQRDERRLPPGARRDATAAQSTSASTSPDGRSRTSRCAELEHEVVALARTWDDRLLERLARSASARSAAGRWLGTLGGALSRVLQVVHGGHAGGRSTSSCLERLREPGEARRRRCRTSTAPASSSHGCASTRPAVVRSSSAVDADARGPRPARSIEEVPVRVAGPADDPDAEIFIHDYGVLGPGGEPLDRRLRRGPGLRCGLRRLARRDGAPIASIDSCSSPDSPGERSRGSARCGRTCCASAPGSRSTTRTTRSPRTRRSRPTSPPTSACDTTRRPRGTNLPRRHSATRSSPRWTRFPRSTTTVSFARTCT